MQIVQSTPTRLRIYIAGGRKAEPGEFVKAHWALAQSWIRRRSVKAPPTSYVLGFFKKGVIPSDPAAQFNSIIPHHGGVRV